MSKFTPGPWLRSSGEWDGIEIERNKQRVVLFETLIREDGLPEEEQEANVKLVLKAPEMHQLIIDLKYTLESMYNPDSDFAETADKYLDKAHNLLTEIDRE